MASIDNHSDRDGIPKILDMEGYRRWSPQISGYLARKQCANIIYPAYIAPVLVLPAVAAELQAASNLAAIAAHTIAEAK